MIRLVLLVPFLGYGVYKLLDRRRGWTLIEVSGSHPTREVHVPRSRIDELMRMREMEP